MTLAQRMNEFQAQCIREYLHQAEGSSTNAAKLAGYNRTAFLNLMARHGITTRKNPRHRGNEAWRSLNG